MRGYVALLSVLVAGVASGADAPAMSLAFYKTEIVLFTRDAPLDSGQAEQLLATARPQLHSPLAAFVATPRGSAYRLDQADDLVPFEGRPASTELVRNAAPATPTAPTTPTPPPTPIEKARAKLATLEAQWLDESLEWLPAAQLALTRERNSISRAAGLHLVWHGAWIQPVPDRDTEAPLPMLLQVGERNGEEFQVEGRVDVTRGRFLHFDVELWTRDGTDGAYVSLTENRRLKSGELNYFDHPRLGMLVRIDPLELPPELSAELAALAKANQ